MPVGTCSHQAPLDYRSLIWPSRSFLLLTSAQGVDLGSREKRGATFLLSTPPPLEGQKMGDPGGAGVGQLG